MDDDRVMRRIRRRLLSYIVRTHQRRLAALRRGLGEHRNATEA